MIAGQSCSSRTGSQRSEVLRGDALAPVAYVWADAEPVASVVSGISERRESGGRDQAVETAQDGPPGRSEHPPVTKSAPAFGLAEREPIGR